MKIMKLANNKVDYATATTYTNKEGVHYFNLYLGTPGVNTWLWKCYLDKKYFVPDTSTSTMTLDKDNYNILPIKYRKKGVSKYIKDSKGNISYNIVLDTEVSHVNDVLVLWELSNKKMSDVTYDITGDALIIGKASTGRDRGTGGDIIPALAIEITGDCKLEWSGMYNKEEVRQVIEYVYTDKNWKINPMQVVPVTADDKE